MIVGAWSFLEAKITDFGIAKLAEEEIGAWAESQGSTQSKTVLGAIPYRSPESIEDFKIATCPSDVWSIGAIVYRLLAGQPPFGSGLKSIPKILTAAQPVIPEFLKSAQFLELGKSLWHILVSCMAKDPLGRPTADQLVVLCEELCYSIDRYELGEIKFIRDKRTGFILADHGRNLMYHEASFYGPGSIAVGKRVWMARHPGSGNDRAFPIVYLK